MFMIQQNNYFILLFLIAFTSQVYEYVDGVSSAGHRLYEDLFEDYNPDLRPVRHDNHTLDVRLDLGILYLNEIDAQKQIMKLSGWLIVTWRDEYMTWNPSTYNDVNRLVLPPTKLWRPLLALRNSAGAVYTEMLYQNFHVIVHFTGDVFWQPAGELESVCTIEITYYPFDYQVCSLVYENWVSLEKEVNLSAANDAVNFDTFVENGEWKILRTKVIRHVQYFACCPEDGYPVLIFKLYLERKPLFYTVNILLPVLLLSVLELLTFCLPCESGEKISLGVTTILGFTVFSLLVAENVPKTSGSTPVIVIYMTIAMTMSAFSICCSVIVLALHDSPTDRRPPLWLRRFTKSCLVNCCVKPCTTQKVSIKTNIESQELHGSIKNTNNKDSDCDNVVKTLSDNRGVFDRLCNNIQIIVNKINIEEERSAITEEWKAVASAFNKILFYIVLTVLVVSSIAVLGLVPLGKTWPETD